MNRQNGFTIIELLIAMVVFSVVLLMVSLSVIEIHRVYYKGLTNSKTQEATRSIIQDVSQAIQFNGGQINSDSDVICVGNRRYSYVINQQVTDSPVQHGLVADSPGTCNIASPADFATFNANSASDPDSELLGTNMRLSKFSVATVPGATNLYKVTVRVIYGDNDLLVDDVKADGSSGTDGVYDKCGPQRAGSQFCAVSELSTIVQQRVK